MAEGEGEETTRGTTKTKTTGIMRVWDAVAVTPTQRELVLLGRVRVNGIAEKILGNREASGLTD